MRNRLFIVSILSMVLLSCGQSEQAAEATDTNTDIDVENAQAETAGERQDAVPEMPTTEGSVKPDVRQTAAVTAGTVQTAAAEPAESESIADGEAVYKQACISCHMTGAAGAPKNGDASAWQPRLAKGVDALVQSAIVGVPGTAMVAKGACSTCSDDDIRAAVEYMVAQSR